MPAYDGLEEDVMLLHGLDDSSRDGSISTVHENEGKDAVDVFTEAMGDFSGNRSMLDGIGKFGLGIGSDGRFQTDYADLSPQAVSEDKEKFTGLIEQLGFALKRSDSLGQMDDLSVDVIRQAASKTWGALSQFGEDVKKKFVASIQKIKHFVTKGDRAKRKAKEEDRKSKTNISEALRVHKKNQRKWRNIRNAAARVSGDIGALGGFATQVDKMLNNRTERLKKLRVFHANLSKQRKIKSKEYDSITAEARALFKRLPGVGDLGISPGIVAKYVAIAGVIAGIVVILVKIYQNFDGLTSSSEKEIEKEEKTSERIDKVKEKVMNEWADEMKNVPYDPKSHEPYQEIRDDEGRLVAVRWKDKLATRDISEESSDKHVERESEKTKDVTKTDEGMLSKMAVPLAVGGVAVVGLIAMSKSGTIKETRKQLTTPVKTRPPSSSGGSSGSGSLSNG